MSAVRQWHLRGGGHVTEAILPFDADLDALYPRRIPAAETRTGAAWVAAENGNQLLILDERQNGLPENKNVTVLMFEGGAAAGCVFAKVVLALIQESIQHPVRSKEPEGGTGSTPAAPPTLPLPRTQTTVTLPILQTRKVRTKYDA